MWESWLLSLEMPEKVMMDRRRPWGGEMELGELYWSNMMLRIEWLNQAR